MKTHSAFEDDSSTPSLTTTVSGGRVCITLRGDWNLTEPRSVALQNDLETAKNTLALPSNRELIFDCTALGSWDTSLVSVVIQLKQAATESVDIHDASLPEGIRNLVGLALAVPPNAAARRSDEQHSSLEAIGEMALVMPRMLRNGCDFLGEITLAFGRVLRGRSACTSTNVWLCIQEAGVASLPIVSLISLLVGLILAFVGVLQLGMFGAEVYISSLVAVGMTRIMGAIMTGIILAGRVGASYAAIIGTMQVNEEIDALTTLGIAPSDYLVMPRTIALTLMTPLLVIYADCMGILGGFLVGVGILGLDPMEYLVFTQKGFGLNNLWVGVAHGVVFGLVIALIGCYQGLRCGRSAEAVGRATTSAVVFSIVGIVLSTAVLTILCNLLKV